MDIEKLVGQGARVICRSGKFESGQGTCSLLCMEFLGDVRKTGCDHSIRFHGPMARAVLAIALRAAAEEVTKTINELRENGESDLRSARDVSASRLRTLAAQLGGDNA